jgi:prepilin-type N-terminal cleavage/methylation domain-containing protein
MRTRRQGFTLVEIMIVVAIIALLTAIAIPAFLQYRKDAQATICTNSLRLIHHAKEALAIKHNWAAGTAVGANNTVIWQSLAPYLDRATNDVLYCPLNDGVHYNYRVVGTAPTCALYDTDPVAYVDHKLRDLAGN